MTCCYVYFCGCCARGDSAEAAGRSWCVSCCVAPMLGPFAACIWCGDRAAFIQKYNINDNPDTGCEKCLLMCLCGLCATIQELNHAKRVQLSGGLQQGVAVVVMPGQMHMGGPAAYPQAQQQGRPY